MKINKFLLFLIFIFLGFYLFSQEGTEAGGDGDGIIGDFNFGESPNNAKGFTQNIFEFNNLDNINLFNGNLNINIPIGMKYQIGPKLSYQLSLSYNSKIWRKIEPYIVFSDFQIAPYCDPLNGAYARCVYGDTDGIAAPCYNNSAPPYYCVDQSGNRLPFLKVALLSSDKTVGVGWNFHMGRIIRNERGDTLYETPDGSKHKIYSNNSKNKTMDSTYYELITIDGDKAIRDGSGITYIFGKNVNDAEEEPSDDCEETLPPTCVLDMNSKRMDMNEGINGYYLTEMIDEYGNKVIINYYESSPNCSAKSSVVSSISHLIGGQLIEDVVMVEFDDENCAVKSINFKSFNQSNMFSKYEFIISKKDILRPGYDNEYLTVEQYNACNDGNNGYVSCNGKCTRVIQGVPFLDEIIIPFFDSSQVQNIKYEFDYNIDSCEEIFSDESFERSGTLKKIVLPTGGQIEYEYESFDLGNQESIRNGLGCPAQYDPASAKACSSWNNSISGPVTGVKKRKLLRYINNKIETSETTYKHFGCADDAFFRIDCDYDEQVPDRIISVMPIRTRVCNFDNLNKEKYICSDHIFFQGDSLLYGFNFKTLIFTSNNDPNAGEHPNCTSDEYKFYEEIRKIPDWDKEENTSNAIPLSIQGYLCRAYYPYMLGNRYQGIDYNIRIQQSEKIYYNNDDTKTIVIDKNRADPNFWDSNNNTYTQSITCEGTSSDDDSYSLCNGNPSNLGKLKEIYYYFPRNDEGGNFFIFRLPKDSFICEADDIKNSVYYCRNYSQSDYKEVNYEYNTEPNDSNLDLKKEFDGQGNFIKTNYSYFSNGFLKQKQISKSNILEEYKSDYAFGFGKLTKKKFELANHKIIDRGDCSTSTEPIYCGIDPSTQLIRWEKDSSTIKKFYNYDLLGRIKEITPEQINGEELQTTVQYINPNHTKVQKGDQITDYYYDQFGRLVVIAKDVPGGGRVIKVTSFTPSGYVYYESEWILESEIGISEEGYPFYQVDLSNPIPGTKFYDFDYKGRYTKMQKADGNITEILYDGIRYKKVKDHNVDGQISITEYFYDIFGRLIKVIDPLGNETQYTYDFLDNLINVQQCIGLCSGSNAIQERSFSYDHLGNLLSEEHPGIKNPIIYHSYDALGNLLSKTDANLNNWDYEYDSSGRLKKLFLNGNLFQEFNYDGDKIVNGECTAAGNSYGYACGKLIQAWQYPLKSSTTQFKSLHQYFYNGLGGRLSKHLFNSNFLQDSFFVWDYEYNNLGLIKRIYYPVLSKVLEPDYDQYLDYNYLYGLPISMNFCRCYDNSKNTSCAVNKGNCSGANHLYQEIITGREYHPGGLPKTTNFPHGLKEFIIIDNQTMMNRPKNIKLQIGNNILWQTGNYYYDGVGNITKIGDDEFNYDKLSRLIYSKQYLDDIPYGRNYQYDSFGNILKNGPHKLNVNDEGYFIDNRLPSMIENKNLQFAIYDNAGNLIKFGEHSYTYDPANRLIKYKHNDNSGIIDVDYEYWYDVDGERVAKCKRALSMDELEEFTFYLRDEEGNVMTEFKSNFCPAEQSPFLSQSAFKAKENNFYFGGKVVSTEKIEGYTSSCPIWHFYHSDHLGTPRVITDEAGNITATHKYYPYGEEMTSQTQNTLNHKFTSHERDFESNLDYMMARYYHQFMGRFLSPDPQFYYEKGKEQSFNLYNYAINNPFKYTDPTGKMFLLMLPTPGGNIWEWAEEGGSILKESEPPDDEEKKKKEQEELYKEAGIEDPSRPPLIGTESGFGKKAKKELKEAGEYALKKGLEFSITVSSIKTLKELSTIKNISGKELAKVLEKFGYTIIHGGSHSTKVLYKGKRISIPQHANESLKIGTLNRILKKLDIIRKPK